MVTVYTELGDVNSDGYVDINDVTTLIDKVLGNEVENFNAANADVYHDGSIDINDVTHLIDYVLGIVDINPPETETFTVNGVTFTMVAVEGGTFMMGASDDDLGAWAGEKPAHQVTITKGYCIGETEVTQALWLAVMGSNPSEFQGDLNRPVEQVSWNDCQQFITKLNQLTGRTFRLPTEAEWEYAARGGKYSQGYKYAGSNDINEVAWYWFNIPSQEYDTEGCSTQTVATKAPNELGLYDMSGNVWEWCQDWYGSYSSEAQTNPTGPESGPKHVFRGGVWSEIAGYCTVTYRAYFFPGLRKSSTGLRLAL